MYAVSVEAAQGKKVINFAPLPIEERSKVLKEFMPFFAYVEEKSGIETNFVFETDYSKIIEKFRSGKIDMVLLGPLPYIKLRQSYPDAKPIIALHEKDGKPHYRCVLAKFGNDTVDTGRQIRVALTQPLSTCGYYMSSRLVREHYGLDLDRQLFDYTMSHENALLRVLEGRFDIAGVKENIARGYASLGIEVIAQSPYLPGFAFVVNTRTLTKEQIRLLQETIASIPEARYKEWSKELSYGFSPVDEKTYDIFDVDFDTIILHGNTR